MDSSLFDFHKMSLKRRLKTLRKLAHLTKDDIKVLTHDSSLEVKTAEMMIENVVGTTSIPVGIATNFKINDKDYLIPMAIEEPSVIAAASQAAKLARDYGGFKASCDESIMIGQIQLMGVENIQKAKQNIMAKFEEIKNITDQADAVIVKLGGGLKGVEVREIESPRGKMAVVHLFIDVKDTMGANSVNAYCERIAPYLEKLTGGRSVLKIVSSLAVSRIVRVSAIWKKEVIGEETVNGILDAYTFAKFDPFRAATHNKGVMNGIDAVLIATSNDWRAVEAGAHAYASLDGSYAPLTKYEKNKRGDLVGSLELPMAVGIIGGATRINPVSKVALKILDAKNAKDLSIVAAAVGLAYNFAALYGMVKEGIIKSHMKMHAANIASNAGAHGKEIDMVAKILVKEDNITLNRAHDILKDVRKNVRKRKLRRLIKKIERKIERVRERRRKRKLEKTKQKKLKHR